MTFTALPASAMDQTLTSKIREFSALSGTRTEHVTNGSPDLPSGFATLTARAPSTFVPSTLPQATAALRDTESYAAIAAS